MTTRDWLNNLITESLTDRIYQYGQQSEHDPHAGATVDGRHIVVTGYGAFTHLLVDGESWYVTLHKPRKEPTR